MHLSRFNNNREFNENKWVVTLAASGTSLGTKIFAHATIVIEGLLNAEYAQRLNEIEQNYHQELLRSRADYTKSANHFTLGLFVAEYEIIVRQKSFFDILIAQLFREDTVPMTVQFSEGKTYPPYREVQYPTWEPNYPNYISPQLAIDMIESIKKQATEQALPYLLFGGASFYNVGKVGENCVSWAVEKLKIAGVDETRPLDSSSAKFTSRDGCSIL